MSGQVLVVVPPGSIFTSAPSQVDRGHLADVEAALLRDIGAAEGLVVIDGFTSCGLPHHVNTQIESALDRCAAAGQPAFRLWGCDSGFEADPDWTGRGDLPSLEHGSQQAAAAAVSIALAHAEKIVVTGAWASQDGSEGCVNSVEEVLSTILEDHDITVSPDALYVERIEDAPEDEQPLVEIDWNALR